MRKGLWAVVALSALAAGRLVTPAHAEEEDRPPVHEEEGEEGLGPGQEGKPPTEAEQREILEFVGKHNPEMGRHLAEARERKPDVFHHKFREIARMYRNPELREMFARNMKTEGRVRKLIGAYRKAEGKERDSLRGELEQALNEQFDAKLAGHEMHLKKMQEELARQKERIAKRKALKDQIVKKRLAELSGDVEAWDW